MTRTIVAAASVHWPENWPVMRPVWRWLDWLPISEAGATEGTITGEWGRGVSFDVKPTLLPFRRGQGARQRSLRLHTDAQVK